MADVRLLKIGSGCGFAEATDSDRLLAGGVSLGEKSAAGSSSAGRAEFWVRDDAPNLPLFTDDAGDDFELLGLAKDILFGGGSDSSLTTSGDVTLTRDTFYTDLTISNGDDVFLNGNILYVCGTLTINSGGRIVVFGNDGSAGGAGAGGAGGSGGSGGAAGTTGQSTDMFIASNAGGGGGTSPSGAGTGGTGGTASQVGAGGDGGGGGGGGTSIGPGGAGSSGGTITLYKFEGLTDKFHVWSNSAGNFVVTVGGADGGSGGGGGSGGTPATGAGGAGGGGGTGGGWCVIFCKVFVNNGEIRADGGAGGAGGAGEFGGGPPPDDGSGGGGGGGGGGGKVYIVACVFTTVGTINVSGGSGGAAGAGGGAAPGGTAGSSGSAGSVTRIDVKTGTITIT